MNFYNWAIQAGYEKGLQIDKDLLSANKTGKLYSPELCCFVTRRGNMGKRRNTRIYEYNGESLCLQEWGRRYNITGQTISARLKRGFTFEQSLTMSIQSNNQYTKNRVA